MEDVRKDAYRGRFLGHIFMVRIPCYTSAFIAGAPINYNLTRLGRVWNGHEVSCNMNLLGMSANLEQLFLRAFCAGRNSDWSHGQKAKLSRYGGLFCGMMRRLDAGPMYQQDSRDVGHLVSGGN